MRRVSFLKAPIEAEAVHSTTTTVWRASSRIHRGSHSSQVSMSAARICSQSGRELRSFSSREPPMLPASRAPAGTACSRGRAGSAPAHVQHQDGGHCSSAQVRQGWREEPSRKCGQCFKFIKGSARSHHLDGAELTASPRRACRNSGSLATRAKKRPRRAHCSLHRVKWSRRHEDSA